MGAAGSGRYPASTGVSQYNKARRSAIERVHAAFALKVNYRDRNPDAEVVPGLKRKDVLQFIRDVLAIRWAYTNERKTGRPKKST